MDRTGATQSTSSLFLRNATGLVRELSSFDAFNIAFAAVLVPIGFMNVMGFAPQFWPRANLFFSFLLAAPLLACFGLVYLYFTVIMPRSGGDYVWLSRTMNPGVAFVVNLSVTYVFLSWVALVFVEIVRVLMPALGYITGITGGWLANPGKLEAATIVTVLTVFYAWLMMHRTRTVARFLFVLFALVWIGTIAYVVIMGLASHAGFVHRWNVGSGTGLSYAQVIAKAHETGFDLGGGISWSATLLAMVYAFNVYLGFQWVGYYAGEIKNVRRTAVTSIFSAMIASTIAYCTLAAVVYHFFGTNFFGSLVYLGFNPSSNVSLPFAPYIAGLLKFSPGGLFVQCALWLTLLLTVLWFAPAIMMVSARNLFAWSFDRLMPERLTEVSERSHSPVAAVIAIAVILEILNLLNVFSNLASWLLSIIWIEGAAFVIVSFAAGWLPWHKRELHALAPSWARRRFLGLPVITWAASVSLGAWGFVCWAAFSTGFGGSFSLTPMLESAVVPILAVVWYVGMRLYRRSQGVNLASLFQEIPPE